MAELVTLDSSVLVKLFIREDGSDAAARLVADRVEANDPIVAPSWAWAEVGSTLARRLCALAERDADALWHGFLDLPIVYVDDHAIRDRAWEIARAFDMPTLYDAAFMAVTELAAGPAARTFWTADGELVRRLGPRRPSYVRELSELDRQA